MKLIYLTDVHGSFERVRELLQLAVADIYIVAGDLVDIPFYTVQTARRYHDLQTYFHSLRRDRGKAAATLEDFVAALLEEPDLPGELWEKGDRFRYETMRAREILQKHYRLLDNILSRAAPGRAFSLPGNHDMDLRQTRLRGRDLHLQCREAGGLKIAGYGGAAGTTPGIPESFSVVYRDSAGDKNNEMYRFFETVHPDVVVAHHPPYGIHDYAAPMGETGSHALRRYCERHPVLLCLTGHLHDQWGVEEADGTVFLNPSHFGEIVQANGKVSEGGFFYEIEMNGRQINHIRHRKLAGGTIHELVVHERRDGAWLREVVDRERYGALLRGKNCEEPAGG
ncbi:MAG TPA: metallophosphoesterase [Syntrophales bacterium]|jgi:Icc-related predicted phosphoesterase|nr:metallophosphoesterase [Syntrophales bacterium]HON22331.1 metallophosphoesterase [Syntrophales bacterium]HOU76754.1 metallophosphoesterase [Syntrophales bacterium]HPC31877.1 metallophosphoesterase [Syntrophales bacterium]HQG33539.1 metallophosphoesterase [Syntrophales bacterium]